MGRSRRRRGAKSVFMDWSKLRGKFRRRVFCEVLSLKHTFRFPDHCGIFSGCYEGSSKRMAPQCSHLQGGEHSLWQQSSIASSYFFIKLVMVPRFRVNFAGFGLQLALVRMRDPFGIVQNIRDRSTVLLALSKIHLAAFAEVLTGQCPIGVHVLNLDIFSDANCQNCMEVGEMKIRNYFFLHCPA